MTGLFRAVIASLRRTRDPRYVDGGRSSYTPRTAAGVPMSPEGALENATFWAAHRYLTQTVAQLPVRVMATAPDGRRSTPRPFHPVANIFTWRANRELSPFALKETLTGWAITHGNGVAEIESDMAGRVAALWPIHPSRVEFERDVASDALVYKISNGEFGSVTLPPERVFHIRGFGHGPVGLSVVAYAAQSLGAARATEIFGATFFGEGLNPAGFIESPRRLGLEARRSLNAEIAAKLRGPYRANRWPIIDDGMKFTKLSTAPNEAQFIESLQFQVEQVCRWMGVPPQKVYHLLRMTFNNVEQLAIEVVVDSITPWAIRWEEECNAKLFGQNRLGHFVKFDLKGLLRGAFKERQDGLQVMRRNGGLSANEWRELEDMGPIDGDGGDTYIVEGNMTRLDRVGEAAPMAAGADDDDGAELFAAHQAMTRARLSVAELAHA